MTSILKKYLREVALATAVLVVCALGWFVAGGRLDEQMALNSGGGQWSLPDMTRQNPDDALAALNLFPIWGPRSQGAAAPVAVAVKAKAPPVIITGIVDDGGKLYALVLGQGIKSERVAVGEIFPDGALVEAITETTVTVLRDTERKTYKLYEAE